ncbi:MAG: GNAT family N-acetyltransferase [Phycisphaeraceae bacterium]
MSAKTPTIGDHVYTLLEAHEITRDLDQDICHLLCAAFPHSMSTFARTRAWNGSIARWTAMLTDPAGRVLAHVGVVDRRAVLDGAPVQLGGIQNVAVHPDLQGQRLGAMLMQRISDDLGTLPVDAGLLFCSMNRQKFYERFGWVAMATPPLFTDETGKPAIMRPDTLAMWLGTGHPAPSQGQTLDLQGPDW